LAGISQPETKLPDYFPATLRFVLVRGDGSGCIIEFKAGQLRYGYSQWIAACEPKALPSLSADQWERFWAAVNAAGVWHWAPAYEAAAVAAGKFWTLELSPAGRFVHSYGCSAYPGADGPDFPETCAFAKLRHALGQLCGRIAIG
jgi:hypothetical protein